MVSVHTGVIFSFTNSSYFSTKSAEDIGGGIFTSFSILEFGGNTNTFDNNCADIGGGIHVVTSSLNFIGNNLFNLNHAKQDGGGSYGRNNGTIDLSGYISFQDNKAERRAGVFMESCNLTAWRNNCSTKCSSKWSVPANVFERNAARDIGICIINSMLYPIDIMTMKQRWEEEYLQNFVGCVFQGAHCFTATKG